MSTVLRLLGRADEEQSGRTETWLISVLARPFPIKEVVFIGKYCHFG